MVWGGALAKAKNSSADGRSALVAIVDDFEEITTQVAGERAETPAVEDDAAVNGAAPTWNRLTRCLDDGRICLSKNIAERAQGGFALGQKLWLFASSERWCRTVPPWWPRGS
jgi:hypothetical protein